jgi:hypothetical protein
MPNEKQNNSWKDRLDQLDQLPGATLAKDAAWDKLYDRLQEKPRRKKMAWYIPAAACLLLVCFVAWMITNKTKQQDGVAAQPPVQKKHSVAEQLQQTAAANVPERIVVVPQSSKPKVGRENKSIIPSAGALMYSVPVHNEPKEEIVMILQPVANDTVAAIITAAAPRKKLKIVHLNEMGRPVEDEGRMAKSANWHSKVTFNGPDAFAQPTYNNTSHESRDQIKIKVTPQN